mgnify:CR=1 FL=1
MSKTTTLAKPTLANKSKSDTALAFAEAGAAPEKTGTKQAASEIPTTRLNANIPVRLHRALKMRAAAEGKSIGDLVEEWIQSWADK